MSFADALYKKAERLFHAFQGRDPRRDEIVEIKAKPTVALVVGELDGLIYRAVDDDTGKMKGHIHRFNKQNRPVLLVSFDGSQAYILAGGYRFTKRGFEG